MKFPFTLLSFLLNIDEDSLTVQLLEHCTADPCIKVQIPVRPVSEGCFIFDFASLPLEVAWPI